MTYFGQNGASWVESVARATRTFMGFTLHKNQVFGRDVRSPFILTNLATKSGGERGINATVLLYRLDPNRGWVPVWERSHTTEQAIRLFKRCNPWARSTTEDITAPRNRMAEVKGTKHFQLIG